MPAHHTLSAIIATELAPEFVEQRTSKKAVSEGIYFGETSTQNSYVEGNPIVNKFSSTRKNQPMATAPNFNSSLTSYTQGGANSSSTTVSAFGDDDIATTATPTQNESETQASEGGLTSTFDSSSSKIEQVTKSRFQSAGNTGQTYSGSSSATINSNGATTDDPDESSYETITGHTTYKSGKTSDSTTFRESQKFAGLSFSTTSSSVETQSSFSSGASRGETYKTVNSDGDETVDDGGGPTVNPGANNPPAFNNDDGDRTDGEYTPVVIPSTFEDSTTEFTQSEIESTYFDTTTSQSIVAVIQDSNNTSAEITITASQTVINEEVEEDTTITYDTTSLTTSEGTIDTTAETIPLRTKSTFTIYGNAGFATVNTSDETEIAMTDMVQSFSDEGALRPATINLEAEGSTSPPEFDTKITRAQR